jgi:hypothetical protein
MRKSQAISVSMMIALGVLMANGAMANAQNKKSEPRRDRAAYYNRNTSSKHDSGECASNNNDSSGDYLERSSKI